MMKLIFHFLLTNTQVSKIRKAFASSLTANITFSKTQLSKMIQSEIFLPILDLLPIFGPILSSVESAAKSIENLAKETFIKEMQNLLPHGKLAKAVENKPTPESAAKAVKMLKNATLSAGLNTLCKQLTASGITLTNNEIKNIIKVVNSL